MTISDNLLQGLIILVLLTFFLGVFLFWDKIIKVGSNSEWQWYLLCFLMAVFASVASSTVIYGHAQLRISDKQKLWELTGTGGAGIFFGALIILISAGRGSLKRLTLPSDTVTHDSEVNVRRLKGAPVKPKESLPLQNDQAQTSTSGIDYDGKYVAICGPALRDSDTKQDMLAERVKSMGDFERVTIKKGSYVGKIRRGGVAAIRVL